MKVTRRRKKLLDDLKDSRGYCHLKKEALDRTICRNRFGGGFGPVVRQNTEFFFPKSRRIRHQINQPHGHWDRLSQWCWRRMEKISWPDHVRNEEVLLRVNEQRNILHEIRKWKTNWIGYVLRRNCLLKQVIEGKIKGEMEVARRGGRRRKKLLDDLKDRRGYCHLKEEALDCTMWRNRFGGGFGPVVRQNTE